MVYYVDKKWCGTRCGDSKTEKETHPTILPKDIINCPSGYDKWTININNPIYGRGSTGLESIPGAFGIQQWVSPCIRQITGSKLECALGEVDDRFCENNYGKNSPASIAYMNKQCSGDGIVKNKSCTQWKDVNPTEYKKTLGTFCGNSVDNIYKYPVCRTYCQQNPGKCPVIHNRPGGYCSLHVDDDLCGCINSPLNEFNGGSKAQPPATCFDNICMESGYKTNPDYITGGNCPDFMDCSQNINIGDKALLERVNISQICKIEKTTEASAKADMDAAAAATVAENNRDSGLTATLAEEALFRAAKARRQLEYEKENYDANTPAWQQSYNSAISSGPLKQITGTINSTIPDTGVVIGGVEVDEIKPLILLFILIIVMILYRRATVNHNTAPTNYNTAPVNY
jgi:hypothetical protein